MKNKRTETKTAKPGAALLNPFKSPFAPPRQSGIYGQAISSNSYQDVNSDLFWKLFAMALPDESEV